MKVKDLLSVLSGYDKELDIIFCDDSYDSLPEDEVNRDIVLGKEAVTFYGFYDKSLDSVIPVYEDDKSVNCIALSIHSFYVYEI